MKGKELLAKFSGYISAFLLSAVFILISAVTVNKSGRTFYEIFYEGALGFMFGVSIDGLLGMQGLSNGKRSELFLNTKRLHGAAVNDISDCIQELDGWCEKENARALKDGRAKLLISVGLKYSACFDESGVGLGYIKKQIDTSGLSRVKKREARLYNRRERERERVYYKALRLKLTPLSAAVLTVDSVRPDDIHYFGASEKEYERRSFFSDALKKLFTAGIFGYYCVETVLNFSAAAFIWRTLQACIYLSGGIYKMLSAQAFIVGEYRSQLVRKIDYLQMFKNSVIGSADRQAVAGVRSKSE